MTQQVLEAIAGRQFEDRSRMEKLIVNFANLYLRAWPGYQDHLTTGKVWWQVFINAKKTNLVLLQHLISGINTHINLDLAIAAAQTSPGDGIHSLQYDFEKIKDIIEPLAQQIQTRLEQIWWPLKFLTGITNNHQEAVLNFSISNAR